jgi:hypothetical protein
VADCFPDTSSTTLTETAVNSCAPVHTILGELYDPGELAKAV